MTSRYYDESLPRFLNEYFNYLRSNNKSEDTIHGYKIDLRIFIKFMKKYQNNEDTTVLDNVVINDYTLEQFKKITIKDIYSHLSYLEVVRGNSAKSRARKIASIKALYEYLLDMGDIEHNIALKVKSPEIEKKDPIYLRLNEIDAMLNSVDKEDKFYYRDLAILTIFLNCGLRVSELADLREEDVVNDVIDVKRGKGNKQRKIPMNKKVQKAIEEYLNNRDSIITSGKKESLFKIDTKQIGRVVIKHAHKIGRTDITCHKLRHSFCSALAKKNVDVTKLQELLGHQNVQTTIHYTHLDKSDLVDAVNLLD